jgi:cysteine desulfuration protein SufE
MPMNPEFERALARFRALNREMRLELLLRHARKFPELPAALEAARDAGMNRVSECQTPLFLWVGVEGGTVNLNAWAPKEAPTVRGFMGFLLDALDGASVDEVLALPNDLLDQMGLGEILGPTRTHGLSSVVHRIRGDVGRGLAREGAQM